MTDFSPSPRSLWCPLWGSQKWCSCLARVLLGSFTWYLADHGKACGSHRPLFCTIQKDNNGVLWNNPTNKGYLGLEIWYYMYGGRHSFLRSNITRVTVNKYEKISIHLPKLTFHTIHYILPRSIITLIVDWITKVKQFAWKIVHSRRCMYFLSRLWPGACRRGSFIISRVWIEETCYIINIKALMTVNYHKAEEKLPNYRHLH